MKASRAAALQAKAMAQMAETQDEILVRLTAIEKSLKKPKKKAAKKKSPAKKKPAGKKK